jgi:hypothetical protein
MTLSFLLRPSPGSHRRLTAERGAEEEMENPMTDQERNQVLKMIEEGKISPEEGLKLMQALEENPAEEEWKGENESGQAKADRLEPEQIKSGMEGDERIEHIRATVQRLWQIPLWIGVGVSVLSAVGMYLILRGAGANFWFYFLILPLLLGVGLIALAVGSHKARWIYVDIKHTQGEHPGHVYLGFPLPLKLTAWFLRTFGSTIPDLKRTNVDEIIELIETGFKGDAPLIVNVDHGDEGERVQVYLG